VNGPSQPEQLVNEANRRFVELRRERPEGIAAFGEYLLPARKAGVLSAKVKELINLAIALATHSTPCVVRHTKMSLEQGATRDEIMETALVAVGMGGGLAYTQTVYMLDALETWGTGREGTDAKTEA